MAVSGIDAARVPALHTQIPDPDMRKKATQRSLFPFTAEAELLQVEHECVTHGLWQRVNRGFVAWVVHTNG